MVNAPLETRLRDRLAQIEDGSEGTYIALALDAIRAILDVHKPEAARVFNRATFKSHDGYECQECWDGDYDPGREEWPCWTVANVAEALQIPL